MIGERLKQVRLDHDHSQFELAQKLFVSRQTISNWELGKTLPDIEKLLAISEVYGLSLDLLLKEDAQMVNKVKQDAKELRKLKSHKRLMYRFDRVATFSFGAAVFSEKLRWLFVMIAGIAGLISFYHYVYVEDVGEEYLSFWL
ncbi:helix-turn-helix domain-containing protein [Enterococcus sp. CSURQ0835]|uniref:helix-turn-helix domain-containing protein n=1 Tax=Enterococcus sp. CSURQ0835 TaxID=2681394 RepID=UPI0013579191|nr:helix-turn-helix transcriptional regulator [Enterococcus sp. CSURQ0835]